MKKRFILFISICCLVLASGCGVSESDYREVASERDNLKAKIGALEEKLSNADKELSFAGEKISELHKEVKSLSQEVRQLKDERRSLLARLENGNTKGNNQPLEPAPEVDGPSGAPTTNDVPSTDEGAEYYKVRPNDTLWRISRKHKVPLKSLIKLNNIGPSFNIRVGQKIRIR